MRSLPHLSNPWERENVSALSDVLGYVLSGVLDYVWSGVLGCVLSSEFGCVLGGVGLDEECGRWDAECVLKGMEMSVDGVLKGGWDGMGTGEIG